MFYLVLLILVVLLLTPIIIIKENVLYFKQNLLPLILLKINQNVLAIWTGRSEKILPLTGHARHPYRRKYLRKFH